MKIRTRLLLFLLPTLIGSIALVSSLLAYNWYGEIVDGFKTRLKTAVVSAAALVDPEELQEKNLLHSQPLKREFSLIQKELEISDLYLIPPNSPQLASIPKDLHITPIYNSVDNQKVMTGYAPIFDRFGHVMGVVAADIHVDLIAQKFRETLLLILICSGLTILIMIATLFVIANKISRPVQKLNNTALAIAAGQYGESIRVQGPREIAELANTLNTMSECLLENINRLKENSILRERLYGEYECAMLLQHLMLQKNIDNCRSDAIAVKSLTFFSDNPRGFLLDLPKTESSHLFQIHLAEAEEEGFEGMYELLTQYKHSKENKDLTTLFLNRQTATLESKGPHTPLLWSLEQGRFLEPTQKLEPGDLFFLYNRGFARFYQNEQKISEFLSKVLRVFAHEGLETLSSMLQKEIAFATKRKESEEDLHLLCFQALNI